MLEKCELVTRARGAGQSSRLGPSIDAEMDEDGVDIPAGEGAPVVFGEIELGDGTAEGVAAGNIHTGGGEAEERFELSAASAATRERQEELLREFEQLTTAETGQEAFISGTEGNLRIHKQCWKPQKMTIFHPQSGVSESVEMPFEGNGFNYEAESFGNLLLEGELESPIMPLEESLRIMRLMDEIRSAWGLRYPMED